ncbi:hypothetical protein ACIHIX_46020 [Streptomyces sp. NPDC051913]|uniref:hypothetical protein n=1 Tax=Streptomyces sp. NPDC051913 TaxID=3365676 RepID=UPI0037D6AC94
MFAEATAGGRVAAKVALAHTTARLVAAEAGADCAFVSGSITAGLGNETSDADVFVVLTRGSASRASRQVVVGHDRVDIEYTTPDELESLVERLLGLSIDRSNVTRYPSESDLDTLVRLRYAEPAVSSLWLEAFRERLSRHDEAVRRLVIGRWGVMVNSELEDLTGMVLSEDLDGARLVAGKAATFAAKAVAAAAGDVYVGTKWVYSQLRRSAPADFPMTAFQDCVRGRWADVDPWRGASTLWNLAQTCMAVAWTVGWHTTDISRWPTWIPGDIGLHRVPTLMPMRLLDTVVLNHELHRQVTVAPEMALVWSLCNGLSARNVVDVVQPLRAIAPEYASLDEERCHDILVQLEQHRLVVTGERPALELLPC